MPEVKINKPSLDAIQVQLGLTDDEFADKLTISKRSLVNWREGHVSPPWVTVVRIARLLDVPPASISTPVTEEASTR